jgi:tetratricopeptide (TPR) repeat protein
MRLLCTGFHWLQRGAPAVLAEHDVVTVEEDAVRDMWRRPSADWWRDAAPTGWEPDVALVGCPEYSPVPPYLTELPCPVALWVGDWYVNAQASHWLADQVELVLADSTGVRALRNSGIENVDELCPWTFDPELHRPDWDAEPEQDIGFMGNFNEAIQFQRNQLLWRVASMDERWRIRLGGGAFGDAYARFLQRSRITFNYSLTGDINMRCFEAAACGSLVAINAGAVAEVERWFEPGREVVVYDADRPEEALDHYLRDENERRAMARAGWERVQAYGPEQRLSQLLERLGVLAAAGRTIQQSRNRARDGARAVAHLLSTPGSPPLEGAELLLEEAQLADPTDAGIHLSRAVLYTRYAIEHPESMSDAKAWAKNHFLRATQLDPADASIWLAYTQFDEVTGGQHARALAEFVIAGIKAGRLVARADRQLIGSAVTARSVEWQRAILQRREPAEALTKLALVSALELAARVEPFLPQRVSLLQEAVSVADARPQTQWALVEALMQSRRFAEALQWLESFHVSQPLSANAWFLLVRLLVEFGRVDDATALVNACTKAAMRLPIAPTVLPLLREQLGLACSSDALAVPEIAPEDPVSQQSSPVDTLRAPPATPSRR